MGRRKGGWLLLLVLAIPMALYAAWQVKNVVRADMVVSDVPPDRGAPKEQLVATKDKAAKWAGDARKASTVALQYRQPDAADTPADANAAEVVKASAVRAAELNDLDLFLSGVDRPDFKGKMKDDYLAWKVDADRAREDARAVAEWLARPVVAASAADAVRAMNEVGVLIDQYQSRSKFADRGKAAVWRIRARIMVIDALAGQADTQYRAAVQIKLPVEPGNNSVKAARATLKAVRDQVTALDGDVRRADEERATIAGALRGTIDDKGAVAAQFAAGEELLGLFSKDDLFTNPAGGSAWLKDVTVQYRRTKDEKVKALIRDKVQEFCEAFAPPAARLDDAVYFKGTSVKRANIVIEYEEAAGARRDSATLTSNTEGLNEFNVAERHPGKTTDVRHLGAPGRPADLSPTNLSKAAKVYNEERKKVGAGSIGPRWTAKSVEELKKKCEPQRELVDKLKLPRKADDKSPDDGQMIWVRLESLLEGLKVCPELVEGAP